MNSNTLTRKKTHKSNRIIIVTVCLIAIILIFGSKSAANGNTNSDIRVYTSWEVQNGDTLWDIAVQINSEFYNGNANVRELVQHIKTENSIHSVVIQPGEILKIATDLK